MRVIIAGSGFGGLQAALELRGKKEVTEIIIIDSNQTMIYQPDLVYINKGSNYINKKSINLKKLYKSGFSKKQSIKFYNERVVEVRPRDNVLVTSNRKLDFDYLILAFGSVNNYIGIIGSKYSLCLKTPSDYLKVKSEIDDLFLKAKHYSKPSKVVLVGGGVTGVELAAEIKKKVGKYLDVILTHHANRLMNSFPYKVSVYVQKTLKKLGVEIMLGKLAKRFEKGVVVFNDGLTIDASLIIWCGGVKPNPVNYECALRTNQHGAIMVNDYLYSPSKKNIYSVGDGAYQFQNPQPMTAQNAIHQGKHAAKNILLILGKKN